MLQACARRSIEELGNFMVNILLLNGANLNMLGMRETEIYGTQKLADIEAALLEIAADLAVKLDCFQSNAEHELVEKIHGARPAKVQMILINPGAFAHTSIALRDALLATGIPFVEIHISNTHAREAFRHTSYLSDIAVGVITGLGSAGYELALRWAAGKLQP